MSRKISIFLDISAYCTVYALFFPFFRKKYHRKKKRVFNTCYYHKHFQSRITQRFWESNLIQKNVVYLSMQLTYSHLSNPNSQIFLHLIVSILLDIEYFLSYYIIQIHQNFTMTNPYNITKTYMRGENPVFIRVSFSFLFYKC